MTLLRSGRVPTERVPTARLLAYLDDELNPDEAAAIERVSLDSEAVRGKLEALRTLRRALSAPVVALESRDAARHLRAVVSRARPRAARRRAAFLTSPQGVALGSAAMLALGVGLARLLPDSDTLPSAEPSSAEPSSEPVEAFRAKSASGSVNARRWTGIHVYRVAGSGAPERVGTSVRQGDGWLFSYTNSGSPPFERLMIFCVDARRQLHWFHPAYAALGERPRSITIVEGRDVALPEVVWISLPKGALTVYAAFGQSPLEVLDVEAWFETHPEGGAGFAGADAVVTELPVTVE